METDLRPYDYSSSRSRQDAVRDLVEKDLIIYPIKKKGSPSSSELRALTLLELKTMAAYCAVQADLFMAHLLKKHRGK
jgi:hypothetical protein